MGQDARAGPRGKAVVGTAPAAGSPVRTRGAAGGRGGARLLLWLCLSAWKAASVHSSPGGGVSWPGWGRPCHWPGSLRFPASTPSRLANHLPAKLAINSCPSSLAAPWPGWHVVITGSPPPGCPAGRCHHRGGFAGLGTPPRGPQAVARPRRALHSAGAFLGPLLTQAVRGDRARRAVVTVRGHGSAGPGRGLNEPFCLLFFFFMSHF